MSKWPGRKHNGFKSPCSDMALVRPTHISLSKISYLHKPNNVMEIQTLPPNVWQVTKQKVGFYLPLAYTKKVGNNNVIYNIYSTCVL